jgi:TonB family protein
VLQQVFADMVDMAGRAGDIRLLARRLENPRLYGAWAAVLLLHVAVIWILAAGIVMPRGTNGAGHEISVVFVAPGAVAPPKYDPVPEPTMQVADTASEITAPEIEVQDAPSSPMMGQSSADILPPRPDPAFRNVSPALPASFAKLASQAQVMLTILVAPDGSVSDARVAQSSGQSALDQMAAAFAKAKWRFRAATQNGAAVPDWTTVLVRFAPAG